MAGSSQRFRLQNTLYTRRGKLASRRTISDIQLGSSWNGSSPQRICKRSGGRGQFVRDVSVKYGLIPGICWQHGTHNYRVSTTRQAKKKERKIWYKKGNIIC